MHWKLGRFCWQLVTNACLFCEALACLATNESSFQVLAHLLFSNVNAWVEQSAMPFLAHKQEQHCLPVWGSNENEVIRLL